MMFPFAKKDFLESPAFTWDSIKKLLYYPSRYLSKQKRNHSLLSLIYT